MFSSHANLLPPKCIGFCTAAPKIPVSLTMGSFHLNITGKYHVGKVVINERKTISTSVHGNWWISFLCKVTRVKRSFVIFSRPLLPTSFIFLAQGFCAFRKPSSASLASLKPPMICLWKASFCQFFTFSKSSFSKLFLTSWCSSLTLSASVIMAIHAFSKLPYWGPMQKHYQ